MSRMGMHLIVGGAPVVLDLPPGLFRVSVFCEDSWNLRSLAVRAGLDTGYMQPITNGVFTDDGQVFVNGGCYLSCLVAVGSYDDLVVLVSRADSGRW